MDSRRNQMQWLLALTALSLVPVYGLLGWQTGPHGPDSVPGIIWIIEAVAWSLRALVEAWALIYLFSTHTTNQKSQRILSIIEVALILLIIVTVTLLVVSNKRGVPTNDLPVSLFWIWAICVASFGPLMLGGVGIAYRVHEIPEVQQVIVEVPVKEPEYMTPISRWPMAGIMVTYFIQCDRPQYVKIGKSTDLRGRVVQLTMGAVCAATVVGFVEGDREREIQDRFSDDRKFGEWYTISDTLREFILNEAQPVLEDENYHINSLELSRKVAVERRDKIASLMQENKRITQKQLSEMLEVSISTIRNDLKELNGRVKA